MDIGELLRELIVEPLELPEPLRHAEPQHPEARPNPQPQTEAPVHA